MAVQYAFSQITTTGLKLAVDAADPLSYPGSGTTWTDVSGNGFTGTISSSISFATTNRGALVSSNSSSAVSFSGSAADFGTGSFTIEMTFLPSRISGTHWLYSKNSGSFPNFGAFITGSGGSGRITAFYNVSSTVSSSATTAVGSIVTGSNYVLDVTYVPNSVITSVYINSNYIASGSANGLGSLSTSASLLLLNNTTASSAGTVGNLYNFKVYNPYINSSNIRKNYNSMCSRFGLPLALYTPPVPLLLNIYPGAAAAYSLRLLNSSYEGSAIRVRRSSDNTEQDIGFDGDGNLNTAALLLFCGAGNGFVTTWYDQSGNGRNATQTTAGNQPQIVSNGSVILENGKPSVQFDSSDSLRTITTLSLNNSNVSIFNIVKQSTNLDNAGIIVLTPSSGNDYDQSDGLVIETGNATNQFAMLNNFYILDLQEVGTGPTSYALRTAIKTTSYAEIRKNSNLSSSVTKIINSGTSNSILLGQRFLSGGVSNSYGLSGIMQEVILYLSNQSSSRTGIESNINSYYSIY